MKKILQIIFFIALSFFGFKIFGFLDKVPEIESEVNKKITKINKQIEESKPKIKQADEKISNILKQVKKLSFSLIKFGKILDKTMDSLDFLEKNINNFDNSLKEIEVYLDKLNLGLKISNNILSQIEPELNIIKNTTKNINNKLIVLEQISSRKIALLKQIMNYDMFFINSKISNYFKNELQKQLKIQKSIKQAKSNIKKIQKIIPTKQLKKQAEEIIKTPIKTSETIKKQMPINMESFGF